MRRVNLMILMSMLAVPMAFGAVPGFRQNVTCPPLRLRLPEGSAAEQLPPTETFRYVRTWNDGRTEEVECYDPEQLWRAEQRLGLWEDREGNRFELLAPASRRGGPFKRAHVTREEYNAAKEAVGTLKPAEIGAWLGEWTGSPCGKPESLRPVGAVRQARFAVAGGDAVLLFYLKGEGGGPYALRVTPADGNPAAWKKALGQALGGFALAGRAPAAPTKGWITLEEPPYRVYTDLPRKDHRALNRLLADMKVIRAAYANLFPLPADSETPLSTIRVFGRRADYQAYVGEGMAWSGGVFSTTKRELVVLADSDEESNTVRREAIRSVAFHEGFHQYLFLVTPTLATVPTWFNEGHATFFETFRVRGGQGEPTVSPRLETARRAEGMRSAKGLAALMGASQEVFYGAGRDAAYAVSWLLIHWLRTEAPAELRPLPDRYYALLCQGATPAEAQAKVFPAAVLSEIAEGLETFVSRQSQGD